MKTGIMVAIALLLPALLPAHHGPGMRGYDGGKTVVINGEITKCFECGSGSRGHGVVSILVGFTAWEVTLPDTPSLRKAKISLSRLKKGTAVTVTGFANRSFQYKIYAYEIVSQGVTILKYDDRR